MKIKQYLNIFFIIYNMGYMGYADDLDRFIKGQIEFDDIQGCICRGIPIQNAIISALQEASYYSQEEHDLYEKLCYAEVLYSMTFDNGAEL